MRNFFIILVLLVTQCFVYAENIIVDDIKTTKQVFPNNSVNWSYYVWQIDKQIKSQWKKHVRNIENDCEVKVLLVIDKEGKLLDRRIVQSSGIKEVDDIALASVDACTCPKLPEWYTKDSVSVEFTFSARTSAYNKQWFDSLENTPKSKFHKLIIETSKPRK